jgi:hypothetical protein
LTFNKIKYICPKACQIVGLFHTGALSKRYWKRQAAESTGPKELRCCWE